MADMEKLSKQSRCQNPISIDEHRIPKSLVARTEKSTYTACNLKHVEVSVQAPIDIKIYWTWHTSRILEKTPATSHSQQRGFEITWLGWRYGNIREDWYHWAGASDLGCIGSRGAAAHSGCLNCSDFRRKLEAVVVKPAGGVSGQGWASGHWESQSSWHDRARKTSVLLPPSYLPHLAAKLCFSTVVWPRSGCARAL